MRIATWNVNSVKQRLPRLLPWLDERKPDIVCLQETKLADDKLAEKLGQVRRPELGHPIEDLHGPQEARGASVDGTQVHSVRVPSFVVSTEVVFGKQDERLTIRHDAGSTPEPYVEGTLLAVRRAPALVGLTRGLDTLLLDAPG